MNRTVPAALAVLLGLGLAGCATADTTADPAAPSPSTTSQDAGPTATSLQPSPTVAAKGSWVDEAAYRAGAATFHQAGDVVLFFNASWCPTCKATVKSLDTDGVPAGLTVVSVDFDAATDLRKQYGVTVQHTFVQVDEQGRQLAKFTGLSTGEAIAARTT